MKLDPKVKFDDWNNYFQSSQGRIWALDNSWAVKMIIPIQQSNI